MRRQNKGNIVGGAAAFLFLSILGTVVHLIAGLTGNWWSAGVSSVVTGLCGPSLLIALLELPDFLLKSKVAVKIRFLILLGLATGLWVALGFWVPLRAQIETGVVAFAAVLFFGQGLAKEVHS